MKSLSMVSCFVAFGILAVGCGSKGGSELVTVNGESVTMEEFHKYLERKSTVRVMTDNGAVELPVSESLAFQGLQDLVGRKLLMQMAKDEGVYPTDGEVLKELEFRKKLDPNFGERLKQSGLPQSVVKETIMLDLAREKILTKNVTVSLAEVDKYIADNKTQFEEPATVDSSWIFVRSDERKSNVDSALKSGQSFTAVAIALSEAPNARESSGRFSLRQVNQMPKQVADLFATTNESSQSAWLKLSDGWAKFFVEKKTAARAIPITEAIKERVRRQLAQQRGSIAIDLNKRLMDMLKAAKIDVSMFDLKDPWKKAMDQMKKQQDMVVPGTGSSTAPTQPSGN